MTNREYVNQMTDDELAQWVISMNNYCKKCLALYAPISLGECFCADKDRGACIRGWLGKKKPKAEYDSEEIAQRAHYNLVSKAEDILDEIKERFPDTEIVLETPDNLCTARLGDANIYVDMRNALVVDTE